jgi:signal transduction protein with GAF and PtsI domain
VKTKEIEYFKLFRNVCKTINSSLDLKEVLDLITKNVVTVLKAKACTLFLLDREQKRLEVSATCGLNETYLKKGPLDADKSISDSLGGETVLIYDATKDPKVQYPEEAKREGIASILSVPIPVKEKVIGVLRIYTSESRKFSDDEIEFVSGLAEMGGIAIINARMYEQLRKDSQSLVNDTWEWFETMLPRPSC